MSYQNSWWLKVIAKKIIIEYVNKKLIIRGKIQSYVSINFLREKQSGTGKSDYFSSPVIKEAVKKFNPREIHCDLTFPVSRIANSRAI